MSRKYAKNATTKNNVIRLVKALIALAYEEDEDQQDRVLQNQLQGDFKVAWAGSNKIHRIDVSNITKQNLLELVKVWGEGETLKLPEPKEREKVDYKVQRSNAVQDVLDCLKDLGLLKKTGSLPPNSKYWNFHLDFKQKIVGIEDILKVIEERWKDKFGSVKEKTTPASLPENKTLISRDWGEAPDVTDFFGRTEELKTLEKWVLEDKCRLVAVVGMAGIGKTNLSLKLGKGGIGKTDLSLKLANGIQEEFDYVIWRTLLNSPPAEEILSSLVKFLSNQTEINLSGSLGEQISRLLYYLKEHRCLVILDNVETILQSGRRAGQYREGYEGYGELFKKIGETFHQSCLLLTSREKPKDISRLAGERKPVRFWELGCLDYEAGREIFKNKGHFLASDEEWKKLIDFYDGNPLALELAAGHIQDVYEGNISEFIKNGQYIFGEPLEGEEQDERSDMRKLLDWHFNRLSDEEKEVMCWLAIERVAISVSDLKENLLSLESKNKLSSTLESLQRRLPIEKVAKTKSTLQPVLLEYMTQRFVEKISKEITSSHIKIEAFNQYALIKALSNQYVIEDQIQWILNPTKERLNSKFCKSDLEEQLANILEQLHEKLEEREGYAAGNLINLLLHLNFNLSNYNFSRLRIRQAYLQEQAVKYVNFSYCNLSDSVFREDFGIIASVDYLEGKAAAGTTSGDVHLWQIGEEKRIRNFKGHTDWVWGVAFSPDCNYLASAGGDKTVRLWNVNNGDLLHIWLGHEGRIRGLAFSPEGDLVASGDEQGEIRLWDVQSGQLAKAFRFEQKIWANTIAFSPDGSILAVGSQGAILKIWDLCSGKEIKELRDYSKQIFSIDFSPDGNFIAICGYSPEIWLVETASWECQQRLIGYEGWIRDVSFSLDGKMLASCGAEKTVRIWNIETGDCIQTLQGHAKPVRSIVFHNQTILSGGEDQTLKMWDINSGRCIRNIPGYTNPVWSVALSPKSLLVASGDEDSFIRLWELPKQEIPKQISEHKVLGNHNNLTRTLAFNSDSSLLASGSYDGTVKIWNIGDKNSSKLIAKKEIDNSNDRVISVAFSPTDSLIAISYYYGEKVNLWNFETRQLIYTLQILSPEGKRMRSRDVKFSPDGKTLAVSSEEHYIRLWDLENKRYLKPLEGHSDAVWSVSFSPDGKTLASCDGNGSIRLWELETYESRELESHKLRTRSIAFSPDGRKLVSGSDDKALKVWDVNSGECLATLEGHQSWIWSVAFSYDSRMVASSSDDDTVKIWSLENCECLSTLRPDRPYEGMNITGAIGLEEAQKEMLNKLGAFEE